MSNILSIEIKEFFYFCLAGIEISIIFDLFRAKRRAIKTSNILTCIEDIVYWIITGIILINTIARHSSGNIRGYMLVGVVIGVLFYFFLIGKYVLKILTKIFNILLFPVKKIKKFNNLSKKY